MESPSVKIQEITKVAYQPNYTNEVACFVGNFEKGPINKPVYVRNVNEFKFIFGRGIEFHVNDWYQVYNYLQYARGIWVCRAGGNIRRNGCSDPDLNIEINTKLEFEEKYDSITTDSFVFMARTPGPWANILTVSAITKTEYDNNITLDNGIKAKNLFSKFEDDYIAICIFRSKKLVETHYYKEADLEEINTASEYVYIKVQDFTAPFYGENRVLLDYGATGLPTPTDFDEAYNLFNSTDYDIDIIIGNELHNNSAVDLANSRKDAIAFIGIPSIFVDFLLVSVGEVDKVLYTQKDAILITKFLKPSLKMKEQDYNEIDAYIASIPESEFVHFTINVKRQYDGFTHSYKFVNICGDTAGLKSQASIIAPWSPSAGLERGQIKNAYQIFYIVKGRELKKYYLKGLNFIRKNVLTSQKTYISKPSRFDKISTRSLFNHLERETKKILRDYVFGENSSRERSIVASRLRKYLEDVRVNRGFDAGRVHVHGEGNTIIVDIYIKPKYVAEFIQLRVNTIDASTETSTASSTI